MNESSEMVPSRREKLRACLLCGLVKSVTLFRRNGCENCDAVLDLKDNPQKIHDCTSSNFDGIVAMMRNNKSWVAKWQRIDKFTSGIYAVRITGSLPVEIIQDLDNKNIKYRPRDGSNID